MRREISELRDYLNQFYSVAALFLILYLCWLIKQNYEQFLK